MQKFMKKRKKRREKKWTQKFLRYWKQWILRCLPEKKRNNKDIPCSLAKIFSSFKREIYVKEHSRIRLATIYIHQTFHTHAHLDLIVWHFSLWIHCLTLQYIHCKYAL
jgi:hypothetical protein